MTPEQLAELERLEREATADVLPLPCFGFIFDFGDQP
jgi:hypothetical protein